MRVVAFQPEFWHSIPRMNGLLSNRSREIRTGLATIACMYAFLAGLRTVADFDVGWQLAGGRAILAAGKVISTETASYTAQGNPWIYPALSQITLYLLMHMGGWAALSYLSAAASAVTTFAILRAPGIAVAVFAILAAPSIAHRTVARADLFTTVLTAIMLAILLRLFRGQQTKLWLLPLVMVLWVNLHLGYIVGLGLIGAYVFLELLEIPFRERRLAALSRLQFAAPWLGLAALSTLVNPWGWGIYTAILRQGDAMKHHADFINEWASVPWAQAWSEAIDWRSPESGFWWLLGLSVVAAISLARRKEFGFALLLAAAVIVSVRSIRFQALGAIFFVMLAGPEIGRIIGQSSRPPADSSGTPSKQTYKLGLAGLGLALLLILCGIRVPDLVSNRLYLGTGQLTLFGSGPSWWFPERAAAFLQREQLPGNVFHDYSLGGYLSWRMGPEFRTYIDGRAVPFGEAIFFKHRTLMALHPDSTEWMTEANQRNIQIIFHSVARYGGLGSFPLGAYCQSKNWRLVYLDSTAAIFLRSTEANALPLRRLQLSCATAPFVPLSAGGQDGSRGAAENYNELMNRASLMYFLARDAEAIAAMDQAERIYSFDPNLLLLKGQLLQVSGRASEAEQAYRESIRLRPTDASLTALGYFYSSAGRFGEAATILESAAEMSRQPHERWLVAGQARLSARELERAFRDFDRARQASPYRDAAKAQGAEFYARIDEGEARAWAASGGIERAISLMREAVEKTPRNVQRWLTLGEMYQAAGKAAQAEEARTRAKELQAAVPGTGKN